MATQSVIMIKERIQQAINLKEEVLKSDALLAIVQEVIDHCVAAFEQKKKVFFCGNGGSAADAQHLAAEFSGRFYYDRPPLFSEALHVNTSYVTAVANDYSYDEIYARLLKAKGSEGDILIGLSTSGNSANIVRAMEEAETQGMITIAMTGKTGGKLKDKCKYLLNIPSTDTPRIQEVHMLLGHIICEQVEARLFPRS